MFSTPSFWYQRSKSFLSYLLLPFSYLYYHIGKWRFYKKEPYKGKIPIICIGNVTAGGTGKTPMAIFMAQFLMEKGYKPVFVTKGYGGTLTGPLFLNNHTYQETGDEARLLKNYADVIISKNRVAGCMLADQSSYDVIILDDGLQNHPSLHKNICIMMLDRMRGFGNHALIPSGPLREPIDKALQKTNIIVTTGDIEHALPKKLNSIKIPILNARRTLLSQGDSIKGQEVIAFAGIGNPEQFFNMLTNKGADLLETHIFPDHQPYSERIIQRLIKQAQNKNAILVTTEKDMVRIPEQYYSMIYPILAPLNFCDEDLDILDKIIEEILPIKKHTHEFN